MKRRSEMDEVYALLDRLIQRADLAERDLDVYNLARIEALLGQVEIFSKQHHSYCE